MYIAFTVALPVCAFQLGTAFRVREPIRNASDRWAHAVMPCTVGQAAMTTESMTSADYDAVYASIASRYSSLPFACNATFCPQADWAGCVLRVAGHDFMDFKDSNGGSDGCLDLHDEDNNGLHECLYEGEFGASILQSYQEHCLKVSLADFIVIAAESVMHLARQHVISANASAPNVDFKAGFMYGRTTAESCPWAVGRLPNPERSCTANRETMVDSMGLSWRETAALMAVHSLGRAETRHSGYDGFWSDAKNSRMFNNDFYHSLLNKGWVPETVAGNAKKNQWFRSDIGRDDAILGKEMMLNTDLCLAYADPNLDNGELNAGKAMEANLSCCAWRFSSDEEFQPPGTNYLVRGQEFCGKTEYSMDWMSGDEFVQCCLSGHGDVALSCGDPRQLSGPAFEDVKDFALSDGEWLQVFLVAWRKATSNGASGLKGLEY